MNDDRCGAGALATAQSAIDGPTIALPFDNGGPITPNDAFFVRCHNAGIPTSIDGDQHTIKIGGNAAGKPCTLTVAELRAQFTPVELVAVNQGSGNS